MQVNCPVCDQTSEKSFLHSERRDYHHCSRCDVIFVAPQFYLTSEQEKAVYSQHENNPDDMGYRNFLSRAIEPIKQHFQNKQTALDFGSGPGPTLHLIMRELGLVTSHYDVYFNPQTELLEEQYDYVTCTEVIEHIAKAAGHWRLLFGLVKKGGKLSIMTKRHLGVEKFTDWHYKLDPTHIVFYSEQSMRWIAEKNEQSVAFYGADVAIFEHKDT